nr:isoform 2 of bifunctional epoxide hydrolase 2 [Quercus suber]
MADSIEPATVDNLSVDKITPNDKRVTHGYTDVKGVRWRHPTRNCLPRPWLAGPLLGLALPDPDAAESRFAMHRDRLHGGVSPNLSDYTLKAHADGIAGIAKAIGARQIILGGHDWGGMVVYRTAQWHPHLVSHVFSVATPYMEPQTEYLDPAAVIARLPNFGYQLQLGSEEHVVETALREESALRKFLQGVYGGKVESGKPIMTAEEGIRLDVVANDAETVGPSPLLSDEELEFYLAAYQKTSMLGPCNWYRTRKLNHEEDLQLPDSARSGSRQITQPTLFIQALLDIVLLPKMSIGMEDKIPNLTRGEVHASHWALTHTPHETNEQIRQWIEGVVLGGKSKL